MKTGYESIYDVINRIPRGRVATYGQIAELAGIPGQPRRVGYALSALSGNTGVAWHRVINAKGEISPRSGRSSEALQRKLLKQEGIAFDCHARVSLARFQWQPKFR